MARVFVGIFTSTDQIGCASGPSQMHGVIGDRADLLLDELADVPAQEKVRGAEGKLCDETDPI